MKTISYTSNFSGLQDQLRAEKFNKEIEAEVKRRQDEANKQFEEAKIALEKSGAEFVSREDFEKLRASKSGAGGGRAAAGA